MPLTSPGNDDDTGENHQPTLRKNTAEPVEQTLKQNRFDRWSGNGATGRLSTALQEERIIGVEIRVPAMDSTGGKVHQHAAGAPKKGGSRSVGVSRGGRNAKVHVASDGESTVVEIHVSPGDEHDAAHGRRSMAALGASVGAHPLMGRAYERDSTRLPAESFGLTPVVIPRGTVRPHGITTGRRTRGGTWSNASSTA